MMKIILVFFLFINLLLYAQEDSILIEVPTHFLAWDCDLSTEDGFHVYIYSCLDDYHLILFNKWGEIMFETNDQNAHWEAKDEMGEYLADDVYIWQISYRKMTDKDGDGIFELTEEELTGHTYCLN